MDEKIKIVEFRGHKCAIKVKPAEYLDNMVYVSAASKYSGGRKARLSCSKKNLKPTINKLLKAVTRW